MYFKNKSSFLLLAIIVSMMMFIGCNDSYEPVKQGYIAAVRTSTGWELTEDKKSIKFYENGLIPIPMKSADTQWRNEIYFIEVGTYLATESFLKKNDADHRLTLKSGVPVDSDVRFRIFLSRKNTNNLTDILAQVKAGLLTDKNDIKTYQITLKQLYDKFCSMENRAVCRNMASTYDSYKSINSNKKIFSDSCLSLSNRYFEESLVPFQLQSVQASNFQLDNTVLAEQNKLQSVGVEVKRIEAIAKTVKSAGQSYLDYNQQQLDKEWQQTLKEIAKSGNHTFIVSIGGDKPNIAIPSKK